MASTSLADPNLPTAMAADQVIMSGNQAQSRDPHTRDNLKRDKNGFPTRKSRPSFCAPPCVRPSYRNARAVQPLIVH